MRAGLRRRDIFASPSLRYADPRAGLLDGTTWESARPAVCRTLGVSSSGAEEVAGMAARLDAAYRATAGRLPENASVRIDIALDGSPSLSLSALDKLEEPASLVALRLAVQVRMPRVDLPELLLDMHARTGFAAGFTHASERDARAGDLAISVCAVLLAEACNTGFEPLIPLGALLRNRLDTLALRRSRLSWVRQNYVRAETLTRANAALVAAQAAIPLARAWGGGDVASADGLRLAGSLKLGTVQASGLIRTLQTKDRPTRLARALEEWGRVVKSLYMLSYIDDEAYRRRILVQLNRGEGRHQLARTVFHAKRAAFARASAASCASATARARRTSSARWAWWSTSSYCGIRSPWMRR